MFSPFFNYLREFVYELPSSWPPARVEGGSGQQSMTPDPGESAGSAGSAENPDCSRRLVIEQPSHTFGILASPRWCSAFVSSARDSKFCVSSTRDAMFLLRASPGRLLMILEGFGVEISLKVSKTNKIHTFLLGIVVFSRGRNAGGRLLRKPHTCLQPRHLHWRACRSSYH